MTLRELLKGIKKAAKKRNLLDEEIGLYYKDDEVWMYLKLVDSETGQLNWWKVGYTQKDSDVIPFVKPS